MAKALINLAALQDNYQLLKNLAPESETLAVIKADAYGHGLLPVGKALEAMADGFAVARLEEALQLKEAGINHPTLLLEGFLNQKELQAVINHQFKVVLHDESQIELLEKFGGKHDLPLVCWLKVNTGMNRLGFSPELLPEIIERLARYEWLEQECLMMHFANADSGKKQDIEKPLALFEKAKRACSHIQKFSIANSAAVISAPESHAHWNRVGISMYGGNTLPDDGTSLKAVMELSAPIIAINKINKGDSVGYGSTWKAKQETNIAVIGIGYGDGYPRHAKNGTPVNIGGKNYPLAGRVSMDMITVDLGDNESGVQVGDEAILWGSALSADEVADCSDTISYELFCKVTARVKKEYRGG